MDVETTFKFIEQVHSNECLWSITSKAYRNKLLRDDLWNSIAVQFNITGPEAYACFRKLREKSRREAEKCKGSSGAAASQPSKWPFMKSLEFLDDAYKKRKVSNSETWAHDEIITLDDIPLIKSLAHFIVNLAMKTWLPLLEAHLTAYQRKLPKISRQN